MSHNMKTVLIIVGTLFIVVALPFIVIGFIITDFKETTEDILTPAYADADIIKYVEDTHGFKVEVLENEGRDPSSFGGIMMDNATVQRVDGEPVKFTVYISTFGNISGDDYNETVTRTRLNNALQHSNSKKQLESIGFVRVYIGKNDSEPDFSLRFPEEMKFWEEETLRMIYDALPIIKEWQAEAEKQDVDINIVSVNTLQMDVRQEYSSWTELANNLAQDNMGSFTEQFIEENLEKLEEIKGELKELGFSSSSVQCIEVKDYETCGSYSLPLDPLNEIFHDRYFEYDHEGDREKLYKTILLIKKIDLPLTEITIEKISVPHKEADQVYTMKEIEERDGPNSSLITSVTIRDLQEIDGADDIYFDYEF